MGRPCFDQPRLWTKLVGQSLPWGVSVGETQQVEARVDVAVVVRAACGACPLADVQVLLAAVLAAGRTDLGRGEPRIGLNERPAVEPAFIGELADELAPPGVPDRLRQAAVLHHLPRLQRLDHDDLVLVDDASRQLVEEVVPSVLDLLVFLREDEPGLLAVPAAGLLAGERTLRAFEPRLGLS